jgi:hypothetical protein
MKNERTGFIKSVFFLARPKIHIKDRNTRAENIRLRPPRPEIEDRTDSGGRVEQGEHVPSANKANITYPAIITITITISNRTTTGRGGGRERGKTYNSRR